MTGEQREGVRLTNLDEPLFAEANATKRDLVDYLDAMSGLFVPELAGRPLSVIRVLRGQEPFMQKNLPKYAPSWVRSVGMWAQTSQRQVRYALCEDRPTLLWFANQRAVEYHPTLVCHDAWERPTHLVLDIDPPGVAEFPLAVAAALLVREALADAGLTGSVKTSGAKGVHVFAPIRDADHEQAAAATRALAARAERLDPALVTTAFIREDRGSKVFLDSTRSGSATVAAAYSPRARPGVPVSFPLDWAELDRITPGEFTVHTAVAAAAGRAPWRDAFAEPAPLQDALIKEGRAIPVARVQAMHEGKRRARERRRAGD
ncbi:DNA polymerase domain-containing protein [Sciscionella sediminilitoris]|uniref:DNA polymerase domain-containing protein n=1 Tax=Sciscionella sediminilitoris TaxID=1445613 RepID=UPI0004DF9953|nr:ATP-dependent DNA ligase [Sciscionella sp. SE31]